MGTRVAGSTKNRSRKKIFGPTENDGEPGPDYVLLTRKLENVIFYGKKNGRKKSGFLQAGGSASSGPLDRNGGADAGNTTREIRRK